MTDNVIEMKTKSDISKDRMKKIHKKVKEMCEKYEISFCLVLARPDVKAKRMHALHIAQDKLAKDKLVDIDHLRAGLFDLDDGMKRLISLLGGSIK